MPTLLKELSAPLALNLSLMLLIVLLWKLELSVLPDLSALQELLQFPMLALRELLELKGQHVLLDQLLSLEYWKTVCVQRELQELPVTLMLSNAPLDQLAPFVKLAFLLALPWLLELRALPDLTVSQRCKLILIVPKDPLVSHTHQL